MLQILKQQGRDGKGAIREAGTEDTVVPSQELFQLQKTLWSLYNNNAVFVSVDGEKG